MEKYVIKGGNKLSGKIVASSSKNAVLPILAGCLLTNEQVVINECPKIQDVFSMIEIIKSLGVSAEFNGNSLVINSKNLSGYIIDPSLSKKLRASVLMLGALLSRTKKVVMSYPGGCNIGERPIDLHINMIKDLGVDVLDRDNLLVCSMAKDVEGVIKLPYPSVGATENAILISVISSGNTTIINPAKEPEIKDLICFLCKMGAKITCVKNGDIYIEGVKRLHGVEYNPISDRIEVGTFLIATAITGGEIEISNVNNENIFSLIVKLCDNSCKINLKNDIIYLKSGKYKKHFEIETAPYPGFPTDLQAQMTALASLSNGLSVISDNVFPTRFSYTNELSKMGAKINIHGNSAYVFGVKELVGANVTATDLRGGAALVVAGLSAKGKTVINDIYHIQRGYEDLDAKLISLGANIEKK